MKLSARTATKSHRVLLFGPPKSGKTQLAGQLATEYKLIYFDLENGIDTLFKLPQESQDRVEVIALPDTRSFPIAIETMLKTIKGGPVEICEAHGKISCALCKKDSKPITALALNSLDLDTVVIVDSLTQLTNSAIAHITKGQPDDYKLEYNDWANLGKLMDMFLSHVQQAPFNIVCISHETEVEMEDGKNKLVPTAGTRNFSRNTAKYFDEVIYCEVKNRKHIAASSSTYANNILSGSRTGRILETQAEASLIPIFKGEITTSQSAQATPASTAAAQLIKLRQGMTQK
jgi:adenosyl cobinamide kinase/adenosyl cobinamide phosphate guanylyltransferase